jgi:hypothetical protein
MSKFLGMQYGGGKVAVERDGWWMIGYLSEWGAEKKAVHGRAPYSRMRRRKRRRRRRRDLRAF